MLYNMLPYGLHEINTDSEYENEQDYKAPHSFDIDFENEAARIELGFFLMSLAEDDVVYPYEDI